MKILQVCAYAAPYEGNFIKSLKALAEKLADKGIEQIYAFPESAADIRWVKDLMAEAAVYFLPLSKARLRPETYRLLRRIFSDNPDIIAAHSHFELYDVPVELTAPESVKVFWHLHDALENYSDFKSRYVHKIQYGIMHGDAILLSVSEKHLSYVRRIGFPEKNSYYVPNGIDTARIRRAYKSPDDRKYDFLIFGWEYRRKAVDVCAEAVRSGHLKCRVAVVADSVPEELPADMVVFAPVKDINELYSESRCFLHISRAEGQSYALLEALYAGLPVICSDIPENIFASSFPTALMIKSGDADSLALAMKRVMDGIEISESDIEITREAIEKEFSVSSWVNSLLFYYGL